MSVFDEHGSITLADLAGRAVKAERWRVLSKITPARADGTAIPPRLEAKPANIPICYAWITREEYGAEGWLYPTGAWAWMKPDSQVIFAAKLCAADRYWESVGRTAEEHAGPWSVETSDGMVWTVEVTLDYQPVFWATAAPCAGKVGP